MRSLLCSTNFGLRTLERHTRFPEMHLHVDLKIRAFVRAGGFSATSAEAWRKFAEEVDRRFDKSSWAHGFEAANRRRASEIAFTRGDRWRGVWCLARATWLNHRLGIDVPTRTLHRVRRTLFPMAS